MTATGSAGSFRLQAQQAANDLKVVIHTMMDFLQKQDFLAKGNPELALGLIPRGRGLAFTPGSQDGLRQAVEAMLQNKIGCAALHGFNGQFLTEAAGYEDEWQPRPFLSRDFQRRDAVKGGQRVVGQDQIPIVEIHGFEEFRARFDACHMTGYSVPAECRADQRGIVIAVFQMENSNHCMCSLAKGGRSLTNSQ